ncbi:MAG: HD-GYP domain-containing protein [bacterium]|nr:MAG: HD-GYP domain-containing protein [bacterium]KAF0147810.1 MAG: HD-GYP domain-containing protein [bacterium]KAF0167891.1 MAG: HD-GYP domain-containing protein [bacterium]TXT18900.1 MAG: HD-GYP domain-containing protein [bacterium]
MTTTTTASSIKKIPVTLLRAGMYVHDVNCSWMDHPFVTNHFMVNDDKRIREIKALGVRELYIDTARGLDAEDAQTQAEAEREIEARMAKLAGDAQAEPARVSLAAEIEQARRLHGEANRVVRDMLRDIRLGKQIEMDQVEPLVEKMVDSIFRNQDALLPLLRLKNHDDYTFQHSVSVCALLVSFARGLELEREIIREIGIGGLLHDVGKAKVPDEILNKPAKLTEAEFAKMKSHVVQSILILQNTPGISQIALDVAGQHHERFDGTGYPNKLKGEEISLYGRMGAIVDVYDAITSNRVYHRGMSPTAALGRLLEWSRYHFDPALVQAYIKSIGIYPTGSLVRLASGRLGVVREQHSEKMMQPRVLVIYHAEKRYYLPPEELDLARPGCRENILSHEDYSAWDIDPTRWVH